MATIQNVPWFLIAVLYSQVDPSQLYKDMAARMSELWGIYCQYFRNWPWYKKTFLHQINQCSVHATPPSCTNWWAVPLIPPITCDYKLPSRDPSGGTSSTSCCHQLPLAILPSSTSDTKFAPRNQFYLPHTAAAWVSDISKWILA